MDVSYLALLSKSGNFSTGRDESNSGRETTLRLVRSPGFPESTCRFVSLSERATRRGSYVCQIRQGTPDKI